MCHNGVCLCLTTSYIRLTIHYRLGLAYAGSRREDVINLLLPIVSDTSLTMELSAMAALSLGLTFVGSSNGDISLAILQVFMERVEANEEAQLKDKWSRFLALGLALLFV